jgi:hypothetical protein
MGMRLEQEICYNGLPTMHCGVRFVRGSGSAFSAVAGACSYLSRPLGRAGVGIGFVSVSSLHSREGCVKHHCAPRELSGAGQNSNH